MDQLLRQTLEAFVAYERREGLPPTVRALADELGITSSPTFRRMQLLADEGLCRRRVDPNTPSPTRPWVLTDEGRGAAAELKA